MKWITLLLLLLLLDTKCVQAESFVTIEANISYELSPSWQTHDSWEGEIPFEFRVSYVNMINKSAYYTGGFSHISNVLSGPPFNTDKEDVLDRIFIGVGWKFNL